MKEAAPPAHRYASRLARRLIVPIVVFSSAVTLCVTALELHRDYRHDMDAVEAGFGMIEEVHLRPLTRSLWATNYDDVAAQVAGIARLQNVDQVTIREGGGKILAQAGGRRSRGVVARQYQMTYPYLGRTLPIGALTVVVGLDAIHEELAKRALTVLAGNALKTLLVVGFAFYLFHWLVTRHVTAIAQYLRRLEPDKAASPLRLPRSEDHKPNELDEIASEIHQLQVRLLATLATLATSRAELEALARQLLNVHESERRAIASELHDEVGGVLTALKLNLQSLRRTGLEEEALVEGLEMVDDAIQRVRSISHDLRPSILDDLGLIPALTWYCERQALRSGIAIELSLEAMDFADNPQLETTCFRIVQESVTNALRHAAATRIQVVLERAEDGLSLKVTDDGTGFDTAAAQQSGLAGESNGVLGMTRRVKLLGGRLSIESARGAGTRVHAEFLRFDPAFA